MSDAASNTAVKLTQSTLTQTARREPESRHPNFFKGDSRIIDLEICDKLRANFEACQREMVMEEKQQCSSVCGEHRCQLEQGHKGKHRMDGCTWTDAGAARFNKV
jgi:hypothetical protein